VCLARIVSVARGEDDRGQNPGVLPMLVALIGFLRSLVRTRRDLALENVALRQQLVVLRRARPKRLQFESADRIFWACLSRVWARWADVGSCLRLTREIR
jgi:hypothetical protein